MSTTEADTYESDGEEKDEFEDISRQESMQTLSSDVSAKILPLLQGKMDKLPPMPTNTVRIFLSSTFSDFKAERNILFEKAYPKLKEYCRSHGLDFQVMDMRWGVTDEMMNDHQVSALCLQEIKTCQSISCGPYFVTMLGNRYGYRPFPSTIEAEEFEILCKTLDEMGIERRELLKEWFFKDENAVPPEYCLQPIASKLSNYNNMEDDTARDKDRALWADISSKLHSLLRSAAETASKQSHLSKKTAEKYFISVTEDEIRVGLLESQQPSDHCLTYIRQLEGLSKDTSNQWLNKFTDLQSGQIDENARGYMEELCTKKIPNALGEQGILRKYETPWTGEPLELSSDPQHLQYLETFAEEFIKDMKALVDKHITSPEFLSTQVSSELYYEVLHHLKFAVNKNQTFCGREECLKKIKDSFEIQSQSKGPSFIAGESGFGKTALLAKVAMLIPGWILGKTCIITRFLGTSPSSSNVVSMLRSVIEQCCSLFGYLAPRDERMEKLGPLKEVFHNIIQRIGRNHQDTTVVIILDSVDQLSQKFNAHQLSWLPKELPTNVHILVSMLSDRYTVLENAQKRYPDQFFLHLDPLSTQTGEQIITSYLLAQGRTVTDSQKQLIMNTFQKCSQPLYLRLVLDNAIKWESYIPTDNITIGSNVQDAINALYAELEFKYGQIFVWKSLGYLVAGNGGLTSIEMEDVLSCDDAVLDDVYRYHDPPLKDSIRIPPLLWARLETDLKAYLVERRVDGKTVLAWYHRQFWEAAETRYLSNSDITRHAHKSLAELFLQETGIQRTIILSHRKGVTIENADRKVTPQVLESTNARKLNALSYHLWNAGEIQELKEHCILNFRYLFAKVQACGINEVLNELNEYVQSYMPSTQDTQDPDIVLMRDALSLCYEALHADSKLLPFQLKECLAPIEDENKLIGKFVKDARAWITSSEIPMVLPTNQVNFASIKSPQKFSVMFGQSGILSPDERFAIGIWVVKMTKDYYLHIYNLEAREPVCRVPFYRNSPMLCSPDSKHVLLIDNSHLVFHDLQSGDRVLSVILGPQRYDYEQYRCLSISKDYRYAVVGLKTGKPIPTARKDWKTMSRIYLLELQDKNEVVKEAASHEKHHVDALHFSSDDKHVIAVHRNKVEVFSVLTLTKVHKCLTKDIFYGKMSCVLNGINVVAFPVKRHGEGKYHIALFNCDTHDLTMSSAVPEEGVHDHKHEPFEMTFNPNNNEAVLGMCLSHKSEREGKIWVWDKEKDKYQRINLFFHSYNDPSTFEISKDWKYMCVGWYGGETSFVDLVNRKEIHRIQAQNMTINCIRFTSDQSSFFTIARDHVMKMWDVKSILDLAKENINDKPNKYTEPDDPEEEQGNYGFEVLCSDAQAVNVLACDEFVATASSMNKEPPLLWSYENGVNMREMNERNMIAYQTSYEDNILTTGEAVAKKQFASLEVYKNDIVVYRRSTRHKSVVHVSDVSTAKIYAHTLLTECYFQYIPGFDSSTYYMVREGSFEIYKLPDLTVKESIPIPSIAEAVGNMFSSGGKNRLSSYILAITRDCKYFVISTTIQGNYKKYFDLINLETKSIERINYPAGTSINILSLGMHLLVQREQSGFEISTPDKLKVLPDDPYIYKQVLHTDYNAMSSDETHGLTQRVGVIRLWKVSSLTRVHTYRGHITDVLCMAFSPDNSYFASGSIDNTIRFWSVTNGSQLCVFHSYGAIDKIMFRPSGSHLLFRSNVSSQRKRAVILKLLNFENVK